MNEIFYESLKKMAVETKSSKDSFGFLIVFRQIPIKIKLFITESLESIIELSEKIEKLDIIILTLDLFDKNSLNTVKKQLLEEFNETYLFQGLSVLVGMDVEQLFNKAPSKKFKISRFKLEKITQDLNLIYCFEIFNKDTDIDEIYNTLFNDFMLRFQYSNPELFENAREYGKKLLRGFETDNMIHNPSDTKIILKTSRPDLIIDEDNQRIQEITDVLQEQFGLETPQVEVKEVAKPDLGAQIMAERLAYSLDRGRHYNRAVYYIIRKVMDSGAHAVEIIVLRKIKSQSVSTLIYRAGNISQIRRSSPEELDKAVAQCIQNTEFSGVIVKILFDIAKVGGNDENIADRLENATEDIIIEEEEGVLSEDDKNLLINE